MLTTLPQTMTITFSHHSQIPGPLPPVLNSCHKHQPCSLIPRDSSTVNVQLAAEKALGKNTQIDLTWNFLRCTLYTKDNFIASPSLHSQSIQPQGKFCLIFTKKVWPISWVLPHLTSTKSTNLPDHLCMRSWKIDQHSNIFLKSSSMFASGIYYYFLLLFLSIYLCLSYKIPHFPSNIRHTLIHTVFPLLDYKFPQETIYVWFTFTTAKAGFCLYFWTLSKCLFEWMNERNFHLFFASL